MVCSLKPPSGKQSIAISATVDPAAVRDARWILFCVKSIDTEDAARAIAPHLARDAVVLSLQNGVDNIERMRPHIDKQHRSGGGLCRRCHHRAGMRQAQRPRRSDHRRAATPAGQNDVGAELEDIAARFGKAGIPVRISDNVEGELWAKLVMNCAYNAISALIPMQLWPPARDARGAQNHARRRRRNPDRSPQRNASASRARTSSKPCTGWPTPCPRPRRRRPRTSPAAGAPRSITSTAISRGRASFSASRQPVNRTLHALVKLLETSA